MKISIIIPVLNEVQRISTSIEKAWESGADEVIVVDGGSSDGTATVAQKLNCRLLVSSPGRGIQLNAGVSVASHPVLLFLHVDNWLCVQGCDQVRSWIEEQASRENFWGCFHQSIDSSRWLYRWIERGNASRVRWQQLVYGDQAMFVERSMLEEAGGFPNVPLMEDFIVSQRLSKLGRPILLPGPTIVSSRRWETNGVMRQTLRNWLISFSYRMGVSPNSLAKFYHRSKEQ